MLDNLWGHISYFLVDFHEFLLILIFVFAITIFAVYRIFYSNLSEKKKKALMSLVFFILSFFILYSTFEAYFRYRFDQSDSLGFLNVTQRWYARHVVYNNYRYRDTSFDQNKTPGVVRIGVMGDSNAFGYGIKNPNDRFSTVLENKLKQNGYNAQVYNFGVPGEDTYEEVQEYNENIQKFKPDILVWEYFLNDAEPHDQSEGTQVILNTSNAVSPLAKLLSEHSFFFDYVYWRFSSKYTTTFTKLRDADIAQYFIPKVFEKHKEIIEKFTNQLNQNNVKTVVIVFPFLRFLPNYPVDAVEIHTKMGKLFKEDKVTSLIDLLPYLKHSQAKDLVVNRYDTHPNESVHKLAGEKLYEKIFPLLEKTKNNGTIVKNNAVN